MSQSRNRILDVAESLFMKDGYETIKLKDIADELGIKQPSLYYHFPDGKEELYSKVVQRALDRIRSELTEVIHNAPKNVRDQLLSVGEWAIDNMVMSPVVMFRIDFPKLSPQRIAQLSIAAYAAIFSPLRLMFEERGSAGEVIVRNPDVIAGLVLASLEGINQGVTWQQRDTKYQIWEELVDTLLNGILVRE